MGRIPRPSAIMRSHVLSVVLSTVATTLLVINLPFHGPPHHQRHHGYDACPPRSLSTEANITRTDNLYDVQNTTLGFEEVYMISLPLRGDKQDSFALQAAYSNISYSRVDGVVGSTIPKKALPYTMDQDDMTVGCWRAHLNIYRDMIRRNVSTAMIFEDDADWDVALKAQLVQFARGSRFLTNTPEDIIPESPYGNDWDILWFGHAAADDTLPSADAVPDNRRFVIPKDPTVLPPEKRTEVPRPDMSRWEEGPDADLNTRIMLIPTWSINTAAYAVSQRGARKLLHYMSLLSFNDAVDQGMGAMCKFKIADIKCISPYPSIVGVSKPPGNSARWSDIDHVDEWQKDMVNEKGFSVRVMFSVRQNMDRLLAGKKVFKSRIGTEMHVDDIGSAIGHPDWIPIKFPKLITSNKAALGPQPMQVEDMTPKQAGE